MALYCIILFLSGIYTTVAFDNNRSDANSVVGGTDLRCGDDLCQCKRNWASCDGKEKKLQYIPKLPKGITGLSFFNNCLPVINSTTMRNVSVLNPNNLMFSKNKVISISVDAFKHLTSLHTLWMNEPGLIVEELARAFSYLKHNLHIVIIEGMSWTHLPENMFANFTLIWEIGISARIEHIEMKMFSRLIKLKYLDLGNNRLMTCDITDTTLYELRTLNLEDNLLSCVPIFCNIKSQTSAVPGLLKLDLRDNKITELNDENFKCLSRLVQLYIQRNPIKLLGNNFISSLSSLGTLDLTSIGSSNYSSSLVIENNAFYSFTLETLAFTVTDSQVTMFFDSDCIFSNCPNLRDLTFSNKYISVIGERIVSMLSSLTNLETLDMSNSGIQLLPDGLFSRMSSLTELDLSNNHIHSWNGSRLFGNSSISFLDLSFNKISIINQTSFPYSMLKYMESESLDLSDNTYLCTCQTVYSVNWFRIYNHKLMNYPDSYNCFLPSDVSGMELEDYNPSPESCAETNIVLLVSVPVSIISIATLSIIFLVYKCRWRLRYGIFLFNNRHKNYEQIEGLDAFVYRGFVIYSDDDRNWVHNELLHRIEDQEGFRLCIRLRDFDVGKVHVDNIVENMLVSEKIIVILSNNFAKDEWCQFQLLLAETRLLKQNINMLVLLMLEEIQSDCLRASLYQLVTERQYALWSNDETGNDLFWEQTLSQLRRSTVIN